MLKYLAPKLNQLAAAEASAESYLPSVVVFDIMNSCFLIAMQYKIKTIQFHTDCHHFE